MGLLDTNKDMLQVLADQGDVKRMNLQAPVFGVQMVCDLPYLGADDQVQLMDLYRPECYEGTLPVILDVHGGGWYRGDKEINRNYGIFLASKGFAVLSINYTLAQNNDICRQIVDIQRAVCWMRSHASEYDFNMRQFFVCADSAGAHLSLLAYIVDHSDPLRRIYRTKEIGQDVLAFGLVCPVTDLHFITNLPILPIQKKITVGLFGENHKNNPLKYCSSITNVLRTNFKLPPVYFVSSEQDVFKSQSLNLDHLLTRRNDAHQFRFLAKGKYYPLQHSFPVLYPEYSESISVNQEMLQFFRSQLR